MSLTGEMDLAVIWGCNECLTLQKHRELTFNITKQKSSDCVEKILGTGVVKEFDRKVEKKKKKCCFPDFWK